MVAGKSESRVREITNHLGYYRHKYGDVRKCIHCGGILPKSERMPDYAVGLVTAYWEVKNGDASETWKWIEVSPSGSRCEQRKFLLDNDGWLFLELVDRQGKGAWLLPFHKWVDDIEPYLIKYSMSSVRRQTTLRKDGTVIRPGAELLLKDYALKWERGVGWVPGPGHIWWHWARRQLLKQLAVAEQNL